MKRTAVVLALMIFSLALFVPFTVNTQTVQAQTAGYSIQTVDHSVRVLYSGQVVVSDRIQISGQMPSQFQIGLPFQYSSYVIDGKAYDSSNNPLTVNLGVPLQGQSGFYGATVNLPTGTPSTFTVVFILSNSLLTSTATSNGFSLNYPAYPSLTASASAVNANLTLPAGTTLSSIIMGGNTVNTTTYSQNNLAAFTATTANANFTAEPDYMQKASIPTLNRSIKISPNGAVSCTDTYQLVNDATASMGFFKINLPKDATNIAARDYLGRALSISIQAITDVTQVANVTFVEYTASGDSNQIMLDYNLPSATQQSGHFVLNLNLYPYLNYYVNSELVTITPPQGATFVSPSLSTAGVGPSITRSAFQEALTVSQDGITYIDSLFQPQNTLQVTFNYNPLWVAFLPTIWMWVAAVAGAIIVALMTRPKAKVKVVSTKAAAPVAAAVGVSGDQIRTFIDAYEEKMQVTAEIRSLEARVQRGRIPRRRYKVQRAGLETRLATLDKATDSLKEVIRSSGGSHADIIRQLDNAEIEANEANLNITTLETRHNVGEVSLEDYKEQLTDLQRRKEKAESVINGLLLRLRGEIR